MKQLHRSKRGMIRAGTTCTIYAFSRTVQSDYPVQSRPSVELTLHVLVHMFIGKISVLLHT